MACSLVVQLLGVGGRTICTPAHVRSIFFIIALVPMITWVCVRRDVFVVTADKNGVNRNRQCASREGSGNCVGPHL